MEKTHSKTNDPAMLERLLFGISKRWIAGFAAKDAISAARKSNELGISVILNYLGEENREPSDQKISVRISNDYGSTQC
ncbi:MAG: hypothetical protein WB474_00655 [Nitrososphaeraceae archaeon]